MSNIDQRAVELLDKLDLLATKYTPEVIDAAASAVTVTAIGDVIFGLIGACILVTIWRIGKAHIHALDNPRGFSSEGDDFRMLLTVLGGFISGVIAAWWVMSLVDVWTWVAIFNPKLAMAHKILGL